MGDQHSLAMARQNELIEILTAENATLTERVAALVSDNATLVEKLIAATQKKTK